MGFEPTTASLEGWNSTTELRPPLLNFPRSSALCIIIYIVKVFIRLAHSQARRYERRLVWWAGKDSNLGRHKPADLQSAPFGRLGTCPRCVIVLYKTKLQHT